MQNFTFHNPTRIIFGSGQMARVGEEVKKFGGKALFVYGMGSIKKNGIYEKVLASLKEAGIEAVEYAGVKSNPVLSHVRGGVEVAKRENVEVILAVGGGSVIDSAKAIAAGAKVDHDVWDFFTFAKPVKDVLPIVTVVTVSASASEMNGGAVLTKEDSYFKFGISASALYPRVSILDPTALFSLNARYTAYSTVDILAHMWEGYFNGAEKEPILQDRLVEALSRTIMESTEVALKEPENYQARANIMWGSVLAFNGLTTAGVGRAPYPAHMIEHSLSALYDMAHGAGLAIVLPAWMAYTLEEKRARFARLGRELFGLSGDDASVAKKAVQAVREWFSKIGCPVTLKEAGISESEIKKIAENAVHLAELWRMKDYTVEVIAGILKGAVC
ncbi:MAG TPA: iron-containing alcohol dehydrogenase [Syntrophales bacterium]|nr:iron-containing alcohol dehydrogenase [Syntrophales bacterium]HOL59715.1 iron-containing alcohol dehydrogenase [Syntrophales bacterium]HPO35861.1 iron-containing alcohol dehydrogenase [Syntrophales bacterium]